MCFESPVDVPGEDILQVLTLWEQLAAGQGRDGVRVRQIQLKVDHIALLEGLLGVLGDEVPNPRVRHMDSTVEVCRGVSFDGPQKRVQVRLLKGDKEVKEEQINTDSC